jgi:serine/threonine-protein kinase RsbW
LKEKDRMAHLTPAAASPIMSFLEERNFDVVREMRSVSDAASTGIKLSIRVHSHLQFTDLFHAVLMQMAKQVPIPPDRLDWVALSLREAVNNAVLHGNKKDPEKWIEVDMESCGREFVIRVWDEGSGFDQAALTDPRCPENLFRPNGRGIFLIRQFSDRVSFPQKDDGRFGIELVFDLDKDLNQEASK